MNSRTPDKVVAAIIADYVEGIPTVEIAKRYNVSDRTVNRHTLEAGVRPAEPRRAPRPTQATPQPIVDAIVADYRNGDRVRIIAERHGVSHTAVSKFANAAGLTRQQAISERPKRPCERCEKPTNARHGVCQACRTSAARECDLTPSDILDAGRWVRQGLIQVWMPDPVVMHPSEWRASEFEMDEAS